MLKRRAFTLVELMIVVAIIGILAAIAIPNFVAAQYRAKRSEAGPILDGIKTAELAYDAINDRFIEQGSLVPRDITYGPVDKQLIVWSGGSMDLLGWAPDGQVRGGYMVTTASTTDFMVTGVINVDGDSEAATFTCNKDANPKMITGNDTY